MKFLYCLCAAALLLGLTGVANAITFRVLDPTGGQPDFPFVTPGSTLSFSFYDCPASGVPAGDGCFAAYNDSTQVLTSIQVILNDPGGVLGADGVTCSTDVSGEESASGFDSAFTPTSCNELDDVITLDLAGTPGIQPDSTFWLVESGVPDSDIPADDGTFTVATTPEPASIWMVSSAAAMLGLLLFGRRRSIHTSLL